MSSTAQKLKSTVQSLKKSSLIDVRCPFKRVTKTTKKLVGCDTLVVKVNAPATGEAYCTRCKLAFDFQVDSQSGMRPIVEVQR